MKANVVCPHCKSLSVARRETSGSTLGFIVVWFLSLMMVPISGGLSLILGGAYTIGRIIFSKKLCRECGSPHVVSVDSQRGREILKELGYEEE